MCSKIFWFLISVTSSRTCVIILVYMCDCFIINKIHVYLCYYIYLLACIHNLLWSCSHASEVSSRMTPNYSRCLFGSFFHLWNIPKTRGYTRGRRNRWPAGPSVGKQTHDLTVTASDSKTTQSGGDNRKKFPLGAALQVPQNFSFAPL